MTRKDYVKVAAIISRYADSMPATQVAAMACEFADLFEADNPDRFDRALFLRACVGVS